MEIIELTSSNIDEYIEDCLTVQRFLIDPDKEPNEVYFHATAEDSHTCMLGVIEGERLVALGVVSKLVHPVHITGYINNIVVHEDMRGRSIFTHVMNALELKAREWGCDQLVLTCSREPVQPLYFKRGFRTKETEFFLKDL